ELLGGDPEPLMIRLRGAHSLHSFGLCALALLVAMGTPCARAADSPAPSTYALKVVEALPPYEPKEQVTGTIRLWGHGSPKHDFLGKLLHRWDRDFHRYQPYVTIVNDMYGTASAVGALYGRGRSRPSGRRDQPGSRGGVQAGAALRADPLRDRDRQRRCQLLRLRTHGVR